MAKDTTIVFYPHTARIYVGDYEHTGPEPFLKNPGVLPRGVPMEYLKLENGLVFEMTEAEKEERDEVIQSIIPASQHSHGVKPEFKVPGISGEELEEALDELKDQFNQQVTIIVKDFHNHLEYIEKNNNLDREFTDFKSQMRDTIKRNNRMNLYKIVGVSILVSIILHFFMR